MPNPQNLKAPWKKGQSGNPNGRPKNRVTSEWLPKCFGKTRTRQIKALTPEEVNCWERLLIALSAPELQVIAKWDESPAYAKNLSLAILFDMKNGRTATLDKLRDRQYGETTQKIELTGKDGTSLFGKEVSIDEARGIIQSLENDY